MVPLCITRLLQATACRHLLLMKCFAHVVDKENELAIICSVNGNSSRMSLSIQSYWGESVVDDATEVLFALPISLVGL